ncbi:MAG: hypothetical protein AAGH46_09940 [Bacteroidota bacterium]
MKDKEAFRNALIQKIKEVDALILEYRKLNDPEKLVGFIAVKEKLQAQLNQEPSKINRQVAESKEQAFTFSLADPPKRLFEALESLTSKGGDNNFLILHLSQKKGYYLQCCSALHRKSIHCEAISNHYIQPAFQLDEAKIELMQQQNWRLPDERYENFYRTFSLTAGQSLEELWTIMRWAAENIYDVGDVEILARLNLE